MADPTSGWSFGSAIPFIGPLIGAAGSYFGAQQASKDKEAQRAQDLAIFREQQAFQKEQYANQLSQQKRQEEMAYEFAKSGVQWKVSDAVKAGLHPLAAMGASTASGPSLSIGSVGSVSPPRAPGGSPMGAALSSMGQDVSRAMMASATNQTRESMFDATVQSMTLTNMALKNDLLASQLQRIKQGAGPGGPELGTATEAPPDKNVGKRGRNVIGGAEVRAHPGYSQTNSITDEYGEGVGDILYGPLKVFMDWMYHNSGAQSVAEYRSKNERDKSSLRARPLGRR